MEDNKSIFEGKTNTISWDPLGAIITNNGYEMSPAEVLNHEIDHASQKDKNPKQRINDTITPDADYDNKEEKRVITGSEQKTAKNMGKLKEGEVTRTDHEARTYETTDHVSTENKNEIFITP